MTTKRFLPGVLLVGLTAGSATAQYGSNPYPASRPSADLIPSVAPYGQAPPIPADLYSPPDAMMPPGRPAAAASPTALDRVTAPIRPVGGDDSSPFTTLTGQPPVPGQAPLNIPKGSYPSPYDGDAPGCCGPVGRDGQIGTEVYLNNGPTIPYGPGAFVHRLEVGWMVDGGGRSLFFNTSHDAAWVGDLGVSYQYNRGNQWRATELDVRQPNTTNSTTGATVKQPDILTNVIIRDIDRTYFNYGFGRDWWIWGPGATGIEKAWNLRLGALVGGRWGTAHIDMVPTADATGYFRRQNVTEGVFLDIHANLEVPLGTVILFAGVQAQWGYDWTNLAPPGAGDIQNVNVMLTAGFRF
jgi:hypothetical protein